MNWKTLARLLGSRARFVLALDDVKTAEDVSQFLPRLPFSGL